FRSEGTQGLNRNDGAVTADGFARKATGGADQRPDEGVYSALKLRAQYPSMWAEYEVEADPADRPTDADGEVPESGPSASTGEGAIEDEVLDADGGKTGEDEKPWEYSDEAWFASSVPNGLHAGATMAQKGDVKHAKLVFSFRLPRQVTFYGGDALTDAATGDGMTNYADYDGDDYPFYVERSYTDRHNGNTRSYEKLTPKDLRKLGWT